jgi:hypothetical protein
MCHYDRLDVSQKMTTLCVMNEQGSSSGEASALQTLGRFRHECGGMQAPTPKSGSRPAP